MVLPKRLGLVSQVERAAEREAQQHVEHEAQQAVTDAAITQARKTTNAAGSLSPAAARDAYLAGERGIAVQADELLAHGVSGEPGRSSRLGTRSEPVHETSWRIARWRKPWRRTNRT